MLKKAYSFLTSDVFGGGNAEAAHQNRLAIRYFALAGIPMGIANIGAQLATGEPLALALRSAWMLVYFVALALVERYVLPRNYRRTTLMVYLLEAPAMLVSILLGTLWDPAHQAITFLMFIVVLPIFILDRPIRVIGTTVCWSALFAVLCVATKDPSVVQSDLMHALEFLFASIAVSLVVLILRIEVLDSLERTQYHLEHDALTNTRNKLSLQRHIQRYLNRPLVIVQGDIDHLALLNDFYGHEIADEVLHSFATCLKERFGEDNVYRQGGDEMLCIAVNTDEGTVLARIESCRAELHDMRAMAVYSRVTTSFGYVTGIATTDQELHQMVQLADINAHRSSRTGEDGTVGSSFNQEALQAGIVESNLAAHARAYEINQLTGFPSMAYFITRAEELLQHMVLMEKHPVVGFFNLVRFHDFNDNFGYAKGDELIRKLADLLRETLPNRHITYISGSQFGVLCYLAEAQTAVDYINDALSTYKPGHEIVVKAGFVEYHEGDSVISLLDKAKMAHASISDQKHQTFCLYDPRLDEELRFRAYIISHVDEAIEKGWIKVYYQPIVHAASGEICNMEALSRWDDPTYGFLPPMKFIGVLEQERLIYKLSLYVIRRVLQDFAYLQERGIPLVPVSVNLSRTDFFECDMVREVTSLVDASGYSHHMLNIEITESAFSENPGALKAEVDHFRANGFAVWMDDFGSEYSTLNLLEELNFDLIKVDMRFMRNFTAEGRNAIILSDILGMCRRLGITTLVEGVETQEQYDILRELGADKLQGYLFSRPCELSELF